jgi:hypothetical protein
MYLPVTDGCINTYEKRKAIINLFVLQAIIRLDPCPVVRTVRTSRRVSQSPPDVQLVPAVSETQRRGRSCFGGRDFVASAGGQFSRQKRFLSSGRPRGARVFGVTCVRRPRGRLHRLHPAARLARHVTHARVTAFSFAVFVHHRFRDPRRRPRNARHARGEHPNRLRIEAVWGVGRGGEVRVICAGRRRVQKPAPFPFFFFLPQLKKRNPRRGVFHEV